MCEDCYEGLVVIDTPKTRHVAELIRRVYETSHGICGGYLHVLVDDNNYGPVEWYLDKIEKNEDGVPPEDLAIQRECAIALGECSEDEQASAILFYDESAEQFGRDLRAKTVKP